ncbi:MAG TPA: carboxypeptidase-like regulatory domain-containing protein, partial [Anaerolineae bacterium]
MTLLVAVISLIAVAIIGVLVDWLLKSILPGNPRSRPRIIVFGLVAIIALGILAAWFSSGTWPSPTPTSETSIVIHVFDRDSEISISNAKVLLFSDGNRLVGVTDNTGTSKFQIPFLDATGEIDLVVETDNYAIERLNDIQPRDKKIDIPLNQREGSNANVIFLVTDENAAAVPRAEVVLFVEGDVRSQITDSNGIVIFTIAFLGDKIDAKVRVEASGYEPGDQSLTLS